MSLCRACFDICEQSDYAPIEGDVRIMLMFCVPEVDLELSENPVMCNICQTALKNSNEFKQKCLATQRKLEILNKNTARASLNLKVESPPSPERVVKKVAPFKLKLQKRQSEPIKISSLENNEPAHKRPRSEIMRAPKKEESPPPSNVDDVEEEDFLSLLNKSDNVSNPKGGPSISTKIEEVQSDNSKLKEVSKKTNNLNKYECKMCDKAFTIKCSFKSHLYSVQHKRNLANFSVRPKLHKCENCNFSSKYQIGLNKHYPNCPKTRTSSETTRTDTNYAKSKGKKKGLAVSCRKCGQNFINNAGLHSHMRHNHDLVTHRCGSCNFRTSSGKKFIIHKKKAHGEKSSKEGEDSSKDSNTFSCTFKGCNQKFGHEEDCRTHRATHFKGKFDCPICHSTFITYRGMRIHAVRHKEESLLSNGIQKATESISKKDVMEVSPTKRLEVLPYYREKDVKQKNLFEHMNEKTLEISEIQAEVNNDEQQGSVSPIEIEMISPKIEIENPNERPICTVDFCGTIDISDTEDKIPTKDAIDAESQNIQEDEDDTQDGYMLSQETIIQDSQG